MKARSFTPTLGKRPLALDDFVITRLLSMRHDIESVRRYRYVFRRHAYIVIYFYPRRQKRRALVDPVEGNLVSPWNTPRVLHLVNINARKPARQRHYQCPNHSSGHPSHLSASAFRENQKHKCQILLCKQETRLSLTHIRYSSIQMRVHWYTSTILSPVCLAVRAGSKLDYTCLLNKFVGSMSNGWTLNFFLLHVKSICERWFI